MGKKATYTCKYCKEEVVFGEHFCEQAFSGRKTGSSRDKNTPAKYTAKRITIVVISLLLAFSLLVASLGALAFMPVLITILVWIVFLLVGKYRTSAKERNFEKLLLLCNGDIGLAERLIAAEARKAPDLNREECTTRAYDKLYAERARHY